VLTIISPFHAKAKLWIVGRKNTLKNVDSFRRSNPGKLIWFHCASLGEFEQGRPIMEAIRIQYPGILLAITFFSPSGYEFRKNDRIADWIGYLPNDTKETSFLFIEALKPTAAVFVKYEYWPNYFRTLKKNDIPLFIVSAILRPDQRFFGFFKGFWQPLLFAVNHFFVQNEETQNLLNNLGLQNVTLAGDNRLDRVIEIAHNAKEICDIKIATANSIAIVAGSTWADDEILLIRWIENQKQHTPNHSIKLIIVPHETHKQHIDNIMQRAENSVLWSDRATKDLRLYPLIIIDTVGMLSSLYQYASIAYVGGGFGKGIHNTLEAAVWSKPLLFGPNIQKFEEAKNMVKLGGAILIHTYEELEKALFELMNDHAYLEKCSKLNGDYVKSGVGATNKVMQHLEKVGLFKN